jgi:hypothetical protein
VQSREGKSYLIRQILIEADRENIHLDTIEREMLEFSEAENTPPNWVELNAEFDRDYNQAEYEEKIASLIRNRIAGLKAIHSTDLDQWHDAVVALAGEDHYLLVMIGMAQSRIRRSRSHTGRPPHDRLKLILTAAGIVIALLIGMSIADHFGLLAYWPRRN